LQSPQKQSKTLICSLWHRLFDRNIPKKHIMNRKAKNLDALIDAVNHLNNGEVKIAEISENSSEIDR
jgi:hypothetical protein